MNNKSDSIEKMRLTPFQTIIKSLASINKLLLQLFLAIGFILTLRYCSIINFYPSGLTLGDSLFFIAISLAFVFLYSIIVLFLFSAGITISPILSFIQYLILNFYKLIAKKKITKTINFPSILSFEIFPYFIIGIIPIIYTSYKFTTNFEKGLQYTSVILLMSIFWGFINSKPRQSKYSYKKIIFVKIILISVIYLIPVMFIEDTFIDKSMTLIGIKKDSAVIQLSKKYTTFLDINGILPSKITKDNEGIFKNVTVMFQGIGTNIQVKIENFSLTVPSKDIIIGKLD